MIETSQGKISMVAVHRVGNKSNDGRLELSDDVLDVQGTPVETLLTTWFLSNFTSPEFYAFTSPNDDFSLNPLYVAASDIFDDQSSFIESSVTVAKHLFETTQHPNIKSGELYVAHIKGLMVENEIVDAVGIFKSENKEMFLKLRAAKSNFQLDADEGINVKKLDKGCLVLNTHRDDGYKICIVDNTNKQDAQFWKQDFLNVQPWSDAFHHTQNFMNLTKQYVADQMDEEFRVSKADKIDLLNRSVDFFKKRDQFNQNEFEVEVLADAGVIESFRKFGKEYATLNDADIEHNFEISAQAVKRQAKVFKSVLKLDKNFHIYIHGSRDLIEKGFDEVMNKNYYKIYFEEES